MANNKPTTIRTKKILLTLLTFCFLFHHAQLTQTVQSSCIGADSIKTKYKKDACRLAVRRVFHINSNYKDSVLPQKTLKDDYLKALIAVYNATALPVRDTIIQLLNLHTNPIPELNSITVKATGTLNWMQNLQNSIVPVGNIFVDFLMTKYYLYPGPYYQSGNYDIAVLRSDTCLNIQALAKNFTVIPGVFDANPDIGYNDSKNITDSINPNYTGLTYTYGWGTCNNGCDFKISWFFKVYNNCVVEYNGSVGDPLNTAINQNTSSLEPIRVYPNPFNQKIKIDFGFLDLKKMKLSLYNSVGQQINISSNINSTEEIELNSLATGFYYLKIENGFQKKMFKILKN